MTHAMDSMKGEMSGGGQRAGCGDTPDKWGRATGYRKHSCKEREEVGELWQADNLGQED